MKTKFAVLAALAMMPCTSIVVAAAPLPAVSGWVKEIDGFDDQIKRIVATDDGGVAFLAYTSDTCYTEPITLGDMVVKMDAAGAVQWRAFFGGGHVALADITPAKDGGIIAVGTISRPHNQGTCLLAKLNGQGKIEWQKEIPNGMDRTSFSGFGSIIPVADGDFLVLGGIVTFAEGAYDWLLKFGPNGEFRWQYAVECLGPVIGRNLVEAGHGDYYYLCNYDEDIALVRFNLNQHQVTVRWVGTPALDLASGMDKTNDGGFIIVGKSYAADKISGNLWALKLTAAGEIAWQADYGGPAEDAAASVKSAKDGGCLIVGHTASYGIGPKGNVNAWLLKLDKKGSVADSKTLRYRAGDLLLDVAATKDGGWAVAGKLESFFEYSIHDILVLKTDAALTSPCLVKINPAKNATKAATASSTLELIVTYAGIKNGTAVVSSPTCMREADKCP